MANLCNRCGQPLPREDARFCNHCGAEISPNANSSPMPGRAQVVAGQYPSPASGPGAENAHGRPALREQIAFAPPAPPATSSAPGDAPSWLNRLDGMGASTTSRSQMQNFSPDTPPGVVNLPSNTGRPSSPGVSRLPQRELRIKVWEGEAEESSEVEDLPTVPVPSAFAREKNGQSFSPAVRREQPASDSANTAEADREDVDLPTRPMIAQLSVPEQVHAQRSSDRPFPAQSYRQAVPPQSQPGQIPNQQQQGFSTQVSPNPAQSQFRPLSFPGFQQPMAAQTPAVVEKADRPAPSGPKRRKSKMRLVVVLVMLLVLLGGGLIYWLIAFQPFSVPAVTNTSLSFSNASLGIALHYPQGWTSRLDSVHQTASFFDANSVDQVTISVTSSNGSSATTYASKEAAQLGLTAQKNLSPLTFAGTTWQRVQGTLLVSGASDTETVLVAQHGNHFYTLKQIAPAATYAGADSLFFSIFRASFQFL